MLMGAMWILPKQAVAFVIMEVPGRGVARWNAEPHAINGVERSLDGGLRYSLQGGSYEAFRDLLRWQGEPPSVADFQGAVEDAFAVWESVDPATGLGTDLYFVPDLDTPVVAEPNDVDLSERFRLNRGSEIDVVAQYFSGSDGIASNYGDPGITQVTLTSGTTGYAAGVFSGVDIFINRNTAYTLERFTPFLAHEIGHALGLGDVDYARGYGGFLSGFYDDNFDGSSGTTALATLTNSFADRIDPLDPNNSPELEVYDVCTQFDQNQYCHPGIDTPGIQIIMEGTTTPGESRSLALDADTFAARQFLYPFVLVPGDFNADKVLTGRGCGLALERDRTAGPASMVRPDRGRACQSRRSIRLGRTSGHIHRRRGS
jgi:hypothetical protein